MLAKTDLAKIYETILSIPGMNDSIKVGIQIPRKNVWLLSKVIERGLTAKDTDDKSSLLEMLNKETMVALMEVAGQLIEKAGLSAMNEKLQSI